MTEKNDKADGPTWPPAPATDLAEDIVFEASAVYRPVRGRAAVSALMKGVAGYYKRLDFTAQTIDGNVTYLQWAGTLPSGTELQGVTVMTRNAEGRIHHVAVHQRPLAALHEFSTNIGELLSSTTDIPADNFYAPSDPASHSSQG